MTKFDARYYFVKKEPLPCVFCLWAQNNIIISNNILRIIKIIKIIKNY